MKKYTTNFEDTIFATAIQLGREVKSVRLSGITSIVQLFERLRSEFAGLRGMVTIKLRNWSQGWSFSRLITMQPNNVAVAREGVQLSLF